ncbi:hypothetical protein J6590_101274 [Homalodisca vitripennis]|nr:hypothetical protein J6590_101274 [Homalodisca vitripennis]
MSYLEYLQSTYPNLVEIFTIGKSSEGRPLKVVKISSDSSREVKRAIWIDGGTHGREWITPAVALYFIRQLVEHYAKYRNIVDTMDWYIMPVMNPDGYEYSHSKDRFWRKSRAPNKPSSDSERRGRLFWSYGESCKGVDLNRNWDFHWSERGASDDPCKETYAGARAFSEPETKAVADFIMDHKDRMAAFITLHSYSQMWLVPWGYTRSRVKDYDDLVYVGRKAIEALKKVHGTEYDIGTSTSLLYPTSGSADDWAKGKAGIKYSYTVELRDKGSYGFLLPAAQITPTGRETFAAVRALVRAILREYG